ncbi:zinc finger BED domain-containing protein RICESLEEPER 2 [Tanacetum coccineum]
MPLLSQQVLPLRRRYQKGKQRTDERHLNKAKKEVEWIKERDEGGLAWRDGCWVELLIDAIQIDLGCFDNNSDFAKEAKDSFNKSFEGLWDIYFAKYGNPTPSTSSASSSRSNIWNPMLGLLQRLRENPNKQEKNDPLANNEYERYATTNFISHNPTKQFGSFDVLGFWKAKESQFPILSRMARDVLSIQATLVATESAFSLSERVLSNRRTELTPASLEMCMCLKDHLDANERIQHTSNLKNTLEFEEAIYDEEVQAGKAISLSEEEISQDEAASKARSNGFKDEISFDYLFDVLCLKFMYYV